MTSATITFSRRAIDPRTRHILATAHINGTQVRLAEQLAPGDYAPVKKILEALGGVWTRSVDALVFPADRDPAHLIADTLTAGRVPLPARTSDGFVRTPDDIAEHVCGYPYTNLRFLPEGASVLEPSAGAGAIHINFEDGTSPPWNPIPVAPAFWPPTRHSPWYGSGSKTSPTVRSGSAGGSTRPYEPALRRFSGGPAVLSRVIAAQRLCVRQYRARQLWCKLIRLWSPSRVTNPGIPILPGAATNESVQRRWPPAAAVSCCSERKTRVHDVTSNVIKACKSAHVLLFDDGNRRLSSIGATTAPISNSGLDTTSPTRTAGSRGFSQTIFTKPTGGFASSTATMIMNRPWDPARSRYSLVDDPS
jgi:hypothetical protein